MPLPCSQLRVVSDNYPIDGLLNVPFNVLSTADFYVLVTDDIEKVTKQENPKQKSTQTGSNTHSLTHSFSMAVIFLNGEDRVSCFLLEPSGQVHHLVPPH